MPRGKEKSGDFDLVDDDLVIMASQASNGSDDAALELAIAEKFMASKDKKRKDQQRKWHVSARKAISQDTTDSKETMASATQSAKELYQAFTIHHAEEEDRIRATWSMIFEEARKLQKMSKRLHSAIVNEGEESEAKQIKGMGKAQEAVLETQGVIDFILPKPIEL
ncbi:hypothetical protein BDP27DRAFT_1323155 [Rhodocollybia butyracea]|uniref:Uncharacterized protein n=1 Tax=Rhodocollybia butyracea TaxID=206335 RepID=A0A9P5PRH7_9AGAR|nr:hypothetical protein BDP27DRAFT_1323155 [Rhodocollybia butyracea]